MRIEIDQSGKIEKTSKLTVIACSNSQSRSLLVSANDKKVIQNIYRKFGQPKIFRYKLFAILIFVLIKDIIRPSDVIVIDREYLGYEKLIREFLFEISQKKGIKIHKENITFGWIGKKSKAHVKAISSYQSEKADIKFTIADFKKYK